MMLANEAPQEAPEWGISRVLQEYLLFGGTVLQFSEVFPKGL